MEPKKTGGIVGVVVAIMIFISMTALVMTILASLSGCTYSINMVHTEGSAADVVDETQANTPNVSPVISLPTSAL